MNDLTQFTNIVQSSAWLMQALTTLKSIGLPNAYIGAGAVRSVVWDYLHGYPVQAPSADVDVVFFDPSDCGEERDHLIQHRLSEIHPEIPWDVTNQAGVYLWYAEYFGREAPPLSTLEEMIATWPETATAVAVRLTIKDQLDVIAPFGFSDLLNMVVRWNPARVSLEYYRNRVQQKQYQSRWPKLTVLMNGQVP